MKLETRLKKALETKDPNIRLAKLDIVCLISVPQSEIWKRAREEAGKLRNTGAKYW